MQKQYNSYWPLELDTIEHWAYWNNAFSKEECKKIIEIGNKHIFEKATTFGAKEGYRKSKVAWLYPYEETSWIYRRLTDITNELNNKYFKFQIDGFAEGLQFTHYKAPDGKYSKHIDKGHNSLTRKLSIVVQLSDPKTYKNGDLLIHIDEPGTKIEKEIGKLVMFPSYVLHEVTPVSKGERYSLVAWLTGKPFK
jgi:PKHD-type hydroxylase